MSEEDLIKLWKEYDDWESLGMDRTFANFMKYLEKKYWLNKTATKEKP